MKDSFKIILWVCFFAVSLTLSFLMANINADRNFTSGYESGAHAAFLHSKYFNTGMSSGLRTYLIENKIDPQDSLDFVRVIDQWKATDRYKEDEKLFSTFK